MITVTLTPVRRTGILHQDWRDQAACIGADPALFFPAEGETAAEARAICARCPVVKECLDYALSRPEKYGVWAGLAERERYGKAPRARPDTGSVPDGWKRCPACKTVKPRTAFTANRSKADGLGGHCKECTRAADRRRYHQSRTGNPGEAAA